jgi:hypothetical protein
MTTRNDFETQEWEIIRSTLSMVPAAMMRVSSGGIVPELFGVATILASAAFMFTTDLSQSLLNTPFDTSGSPLQGKGQRYTPPHIESFRGEVWHTVREAMALVEEKATPDEIGEFRSMILYIAERLARAGKEGDPLGITGPALTEAETALLHQIADAVGMEWEGE